MLPTLTAVDILLRLVTALLLGGAIGFERSLREQPAGMRTHMLVALGSATFALVSLQAGFYQHFEPVAGGQFLRYDAGRIASNIVVGIGFLGGGAIVHAGMTIKGLTTAASLWVCAAVGLAAGAGMAPLAVLTATLTLFALVVIRYTIEAGRKREVRLAVRIDLEGDFLSRAALLEFVRPVGGKVTGADYTRDLQDNRSRMTFEVRLPDADLEEPLMKRLEELPGLRRVEVTRPD
jgi:putative Mg2+ transporter-C (MgtC) family protein